MPLAIFAFVGFELQTNAAEEMVDPQKDIPVAVSRAGVLAAIAYILPTLGVLFVLPGEEIDGLSGFISAANQAYRDVWGDGFGGVLLQLTVAMLILALATSGAAWMMGSDRTQAVAAMDGAFFPFFGRLHPTLGTPVRVNLLSGTVATIMTIVATLIATKGGDGANAIFSVLLTIAVSTTLLSYLYVFPAAYVLRRKAAHVTRVFRVPGGDSVMLGAVILTTFFTAVGSLEAVFPGLIWKLMGQDYGSFEDAWGVSRTMFEALTLGALLVVTLVAAFGYSAGARVRHATVAPTDDPA